MYQWDFSCAVCGDKFPTKEVTRTKRSGAGDREYNIEIYDTSQEGYFVRLTNSDPLLNSYLQEKKEKLEQDKKELEERIEAKVLDEEFRDSLLSDKTKELEKKYKNEVRDFKHFIYEISIDFQTHTTNKTIPALHPKCFEKALEESKSVTEDKYITVLEREGYETKKLKTRNKMSLDDFSQAFAHFSDFFDLPKNKKEISLEFLHFSEY